MIALAEVKSKLKEVKVKYPDKINPMDEYNSCLYTSRTNPDSHCIAGQLLIEFGLPCPDSEDGSAFDSLSVVKDEFTEGARQAIWRLQMIADNYSEGTAQPLPWQQAIEEWETLY